MWRGRFCKCCKRHPAIRRNVGCSDDLRGTHKHTLYFSYPSSTTLSNQDCGSVGDVGKKGAGNESADTNNDEPLHTLNSPTRRRQFSGFGSNTNEEELAKSTSIKYPNESSTQTVHCVKTVRKVRVCESA